ncbi:glycosyltransferase [Pseudoclavibacter chungangensis]|uniref:Glycosyltransferase n=1 Tax=Pseudoclavibacter chungangensis TaxID=587635 RepID=A0A7J5C3T6_9MICO|nr:glycosyltransferase [Pseudoclavibacter chungangensis]KAB1662439.1 glycosyltransferase [Pseudoclavibacter chungangensis]NYJ68470.1 glycosyltransferase involved in cell wall biosynthesis/LmbE family N-acetylglucosaminyl deacetylase [Pseudoclavibacter chungangensis]
MRLAILCMHTSPYAPLGSADAGGMNVVLRHLTAEFARLGHDVHVYVRRMDPAEPAVAEIAPGLTLHQIDAGPAVVLPKSEIDAWLHDYTEALRAEPRPDVVHSHHWMSAMAGLELAREWDVPHVVSYHSVAAREGAPLSEGEPPESPDRVAGEARAAREADAIVAVSIAESHTVERIGADPDRIRVIRPGVDLGLFAPDESVRCPKEAPYVLFAARLQPLKAADLAVEAIAGFSTRAGDESPHLRIAGDAGKDFADYDAALEELIDGHGIADRVERLGGLEREDFVPLMRCASLVLFPSYSETFGLVALEAAACGVPTVAAPSGGLHEAVVSGVSGVIVPGRVPSRWREVVSGLLADEDARSALGRSARAWAETQSWTRSAEAHLEFYAGLVAGRSATELIAAARRGGGLDEPRLAIERAARERDHEAVFGDAGRVLLVHAHPDDETLTTGPLAAWLASRGIEVDLLTATRGERGEVRDAHDPELAALDGPERIERIGLERERERDAACDALGITGRAWLGEGTARAAGLDERRYADSGMSWVTERIAGPIDDVDTTTLARASITELSGDLEAHVRATAPDVVVVYDRDGGYGHPDHVRLHAATRVAADRTRTPVVEIVTTGPAATPTPPDLPSPAPFGAHRWLHLPEFEAQVREALDAYGTQLEIAGPDVVHVGGQYDPLSTSICLQRVS